MNDFAQSVGTAVQLVIGPKGAAKGVVEVKRRVGGAKEELSADAALAKVLA